MLSAVASKKYLELQLSLAHWLSQNQIARIEVSYVLIFMRSFNEESYIMAWTAWNKSAVQIASCVPWRGST